MAEADTSETPEVHQEGTMTRVSITKCDEDDPAELWRRYIQHDKHEDCYLLLNLETGEMLCSYNRQIGGDAPPEEVYHGRTLWFQIPATLTSKAANALMQKAVPLAQRILDGSTIEWDGNNSVGRLDKDARTASDELAEVCDPPNFHWGQSDMVSEWTVDYWFIDGDEATIDNLGITADTTDEQLDAIVAEQERQAREDTGAEGYVILTGAADYLYELRDQLRDQRRETAAAEASP